MEFNNLEELYIRIKPALSCKQSEMIRDGYNYIKIEDIWNYLKEIKWKIAYNLSLYDMVTDVLSTPNSLIDDYVKTKLNSNERKIYFGEDTYA